MIIVSHDRYFMDRIVDHILAFEGEGKIKDFVGNFSEYRENLKLEEKNPKPVAAPKAETPVVAVAAPVIKPQDPKRKLSFKEQRELETIEKEIPEFEAKRAAILEQLNNEADYDKISKLSAELENLSEKLGNHEMRWLDLQD